jgi:hypothetical protein
MAGLVADSPDMAGLVADSPDMAGLVADSPVMAGLVPAIRASTASAQMAGTSQAITLGRYSGLIILRIGVTRSRAVASACNSDRVVVARVLTSSTVVADGHALTAGVGRRLRKLHPEFGKQVRLGLQ